MAKSKNESNNKNSGTLLTEKDGTQYLSLIHISEISAPLIFVGAVTCCDASYLAAHCRISHRKRRSPPQA